MRAEELSTMSPLDRSIDEVISEGKSVSPHVALLQALDGDRWAADERIRVAQKIRDIMVAAGKWRATSKKTRITNAP